MPALAALLSLVAGLIGIGGLLVDLVHTGWAHSFDSAIYIRSLWGVANDRWWNPLVDLHLLSIHSNVVLLLLAPLTRLMPPADVLIAAQALSYGATLALVTYAAARLGMRRGLGAVGSSLLGLCVAGLAAATPMVTNPFLFDIRPDLIGVPLLTAGLLRAWRKGRFDAGSVVWMLLALPVREEHMIAIVGALGADAALRLLADRNGAGWRVGLKSLRVHLFGIALAVGWWAAYWFVVRPAIGDGSDAVANEVAGTFFATSESGRMRYAIEAVAVFSVALGGLSLLGWRWLGAAVPGLLLLLATQRMPELALNFHYVMFITPGLLVAAVAGLDRALVWTGELPADVQRRRRALGSVGIALLAVAAFATSSALPGGGRYRADNFGPRGVLDATAEAGQADLAAMHVMARTIPPGDGVALPYGIVADVADREFVWSTESLLEMAASGQQLPAELVWLGVAGRDASGFGRWAVDAGGFRAVAAVGSRMMLLTRAPVTPRWDLLGATAGACPSPALDWSEHGVRLCEARWEADGHVMVAVERVGDAAVRIGITPPGQDEPVIDVRGLRGLIPVHHTEVGWIVPLRSVSPIDAPAVDVVLTTPEGIRERLRLPRPAQLAP